MSGPLKWLKVRQLRTQIDQSPTRTRQRMCESQVSKKGLLPHQSSSFALRADGSEKDEGRTGGSCRVLDQHHRSHRRCKTKSCVGQLVKGWAE